ncbi:MAG: GMC family oxidoreductase N-terminal domain-containing protein, partial [Vicinamibacteria bacterium]
MIIEGKSVTGEILERADVCVVGSGAGGAPFAYEMAAAGKKVVMLEAGSYHPSHTFNEREDDMVGRLYVDQGNQGPKDASITLYQGKCVGGSTVINAMICFRTPDYVLEEWGKDHGIEGMSPAELAPFFERVEQTVSAKENSTAEINVNSQKMAEGCK